MQTTALVTDILVHKLRGRKVFEGIDELAESIKTNGLIQPLVVAHIPEILKKENPGKKYLLICGERRFRACVKALLLDIPITITDKLSEEQALRLELEENLNRKDLTFDEASELTSRIHQCQLKIDPNWTLDDTANLMHISEGEVSKHLKIHEELNKQPDKDKLKKMTRSQVIRELDNRKNAQALAAKSNRVYKVDMRLGHCMNLIKQLPNDSVDCIITDPPYGNSVIEESEKGSNQFSTAETHTDNLSSEEIKSLFKDLFPEMFRVLKPSCHFYLFFGAEHWPWITEYLVKAGFEYQCYPCIWDKTAPTTRPTGYSFLNRYEMFLYGWKPPKKRRLNRDLQSVLPIKPVPSQARIHRYQKPPELIKLLIDASTEVGEVVLDPFAGSGSIIYTAVKLKRQGIGFEINEKHVKHSILLDVETL